MILRGWARYARWLHTRWPAGTVEKLPEVREDGSTAVPGVYVAGDLTGIPLLKFALDSGARVVQRIAADLGAAPAAGRAAARPAPGEASTPRGPAAPRGPAPGAPPLPPREAPLDLAILGAGVSGMAAALEARRLGLSFRVIEAAEPFSTLIDFPRAKPIYTYPMAMVPEGQLQARATIKEALVEELRAQVARAGIEVTRARAERVGRGPGHLLVILAAGEPVRARRVLVAIGRSGNFRRLGVPGEETGRVYHRLHDPADFAGKRALVVGSGDSALETAIALAGSGARVTLSCRREEITRPRPENIAMLKALLRDPTAEVGAEHPSSERVATAAGPSAAKPRAPGSVELRLGTRVQEIREGEVLLVGAQGAQEPLTGLPVRESRSAGATGARAGARRGSTGARATAPAGGGTGARAGAAGAPGSPETIANDVVFAMVGREAPLGFFRRSGVAIHGEMTKQRWAAMGLFLLFCSWLYNWKSGGWMSEVWHRNHWFPTNLPDLLAAAGGAVAAAAADPRTLPGTLAISAAGPSFWYTLAYSAVVVVFGFRRIARRKTPYVTAQTLTLMAVQVFPLFLVPEVILPLLDRHGLLPVALADALFPAANYGHGREFWRAYGLILAWPLNVYNIFTHEPLWWWIAIGFVQTCVLIPLGIWFFGKGVYCGWVCSCGALAETLGDTHRHKMPHGPRWNRANLAGQGVLAVATALLLVRVAGWAIPGYDWADAVFEPLKNQYKWIVDVFLAGVVGYGVYFWYSGRAWCRFLCPLAALMHVYARFSRFAIVSDKKKCISCGACTAICHQGIDVMSFANKGAPMQDPECVRCSACVSACPTGVLTFGQVDRGGGLISLDSLSASPVQMREGR